MTPLDQDKNHLTDLWKKYAPTHLTSDGSKKLTNNGKSDPNDWLGVSTENVAVEGEPLLGFEGEKLREAKQQTARTTSPLPSPSPAAPLPRQRLLRWRVPLPCLRSPHPRARRMIIYSNPRFAPRLAPL